MFRVGPDKNMSNEPSDGLSIVLHILVGYLVFFISIRKTINK
jgi:hypothetical protein